MFEEAAMVEACWLNYYEEEWSALEESMCELRKYYPEAYADTRDEMISLIWGE